jgi:hypothetical protein
MSDLIKVTGAANHTVGVECPHCKHFFDATDDQHDHEVTNAMFENTAESCTNMNIEMFCSECDGEFILDELVY